MSKKIILYGFVLAMLTISLKMMEYKLVIIDHSLELYGGLLAVIFTMLGIYVGKKLTGKKEVIIERMVFIGQPVPVGATGFSADDVLLDKLGISKREYEILELIAMGCSNQEIADRAFVSVSTVKTHVSNLFVKLDVQRRTQAVKKAKELNLIP